MINWQWWFLSLTFEDDIDSLKSVIINESLINEYFKLVVFNIDINAWIININITY